MEPPTQPPGRREQFEGPCHSLDVSLPLKEDFLVAMVTAGWEARQMPHAFSVRQRSRGKKTRTGYFRWGAWEDGAVNPIDPKIYLVAQHKAVAICLRDLAPANQHAARGGGQR